MTIASQLIQVANSKSAIAAAIEAKGVTVGAALFADYAGKIAEITSGGAEPTASGWVRPADWLPLPEVLATEQKFVGLYAVDDDDSNFVAILARGAYTVDWGDGVVENFANNVKAEHQYNFASLPIDSLSSRGYKQVVVTLIPQSGQNITLLNLNQRPTGFGNQQRSLQWLDLAICVPMATSLTVSGTSTNAALWSLQQCKIFSFGLVSNLDSLFNNCYSLQSVDLRTTPAITYVGSLFFKCVSLRTVPLFDISGVPNIEYMFGDCWSLRSIPLFNISSMTTLNSFYFSFLRCYSLQEVPALQVPASVTSNSSFSSSFASCTSLGRSQLAGVKVTHSYSGCNLSATALNEVFTNLATVTGQTITITNNPGAATCNRSIATAKGWTVTG